MVHRVIIKQFTIKLITTQKNHHKLNLQLLSVGLKSEIIVHICYVHLKKQKLV